MLRKNAILRFSEQLSKYDDPLLCQRVERLYHKIFEGVETDALVDKLRNTVGDNSMETDGNGVFGLSGAAGFDENVSPEQAAEERINDGVESAELGDFGTALSTETPPSEDDLGLGMDDGTDEFGADDGLDDDLGLPGLDDEVGELPIEEEPTEPIDVNGDSGADDSFADDDELDSLLEPAD